MEKFGIYKRKSCLKRHICSTRQIPKVRAKCIHLLYAVQIRLYKDGALGSFAITTFYYPKRSPQSSLLIFYCVLWVIFKTASVLKKNKTKTTLNLYMEVMTIHLHQSSELGVCSTPRCMENLYASLLAMQWCGQRESVGCWAWVCQQEQKHWPRPQIILSISTLRPKWELPLVILVIFLSLVLRHPAQKLSMSLHKLCTLIYDYLKTNASSV